MAIVLFSTAASGFSPLTKPEDILKVSFLPAENAKAGDIIKTKLQIEISKGWHIFSDKPEVPGITPTKIELENSDDFFLESVVFPKPVSTRSEVFHKTLSFYQDKIFVGLHLKLKRQVSGDFPVKGVLLFQGCSDSVCLRPSKVHFEGVQYVQ